MARVISVVKHPNGFVYNYQEDVSPKNGKTFSLSEMQKIVNGHIELVDLGDEFMVVNEEGALDENRLLNTTATAIKHNHYGFYEQIFGNVLICEKSQIE